MFTKEVTNIFEKYKQVKFTQHESGGILLGKVYDEVIVVDQVSEPSPDDQSGRFYFDRNILKAQHIVKKVWEESNGERIYLGEWHTHPEDVPRPSSDDKKLLKNMVEDTQMEIDFLFMAIIGRKQPHVAVLQKNERISKQLQKPRKLKIIIYRDQNGKTYGFQVGGYLNIADKGFDIYNSAFSLIFLGTVRSITILTSIQNYLRIEENGFLRLILLDTENEKANILLEAMVLQIELLIEAMKEKELDSYITLEFKS